MTGKGYFPIILMVSLFIISHQRENDGKFCPTHRVRHPTKCNLFFYCVNITKPQATYVWVPGKCQLGLVFQPILGMCVIPEDYEDCHGESEKTFPEMIHKIKNNLHHLFAEEPNLEFEVTLKPYEEHVQSSQASSFFGNLPDYRLNADSRLSSKHNLNDYHPYTSMHMGGMWEPVQQANNKDKPQRMPPIGRPYLNPENYKTTSMNTENLQPSYTLTSTSNYGNWNDKHMTVPSSFTTGSKQPNLNHSHTDNSNYYGNLNKIHPSLIELLQEDEHYKHHSGTENSNITQDYLHKNNNENYNYKNDDTLNEHSKVNKTSPINQRDRMNHTKNTSTSKRPSTPLKAENQETLSMKIANRQSEVQCKNKARQPDSLDCTKYYTCSSNGALASYKCPYQTAFNAYTQKCDNKVYDDCLKEMTSSTSVVTETVQYDEIEHVPLVQTDGNDDTSQESFECTSEGKHQDITSEQHYFMCILDPETQTLTQHRLLCPQNLLYCPLRKICTYSEQCYQ